MGFGRKVTDASAEARRAYRLARRLGVRGVAAELPSPALGDRLRSGVDRFAAARAGLSAGDGGLVDTREGEHTHLARVVERFTATDALDANLALVADALRAAGVPFRLVAADTNARRVVAVAESDRADALRALPAALSDSGRAVYAAPVRGGRLGGVGLLSARDPGADVMRVFEVLAAGSGALVAGAEYGCEVEFWARGVDGTLQGPRPHRAGRELPPGRPAGAARVGGRDYPADPALTEPHAFDVTFDVDLVYTWVDGADPAWRARRDEAWAATDHDAHSTLAANPSRYADREELRYSLRSVAAYADWVRRIHIVTDHQVPIWLETAHPKIHVVDHEELFAGVQDALPTFNSHAIESRLHHIDGLAEHYLYLNDDMLLGSPLSPEDFFLGNGIAQFLPSPKSVPPGPAGTADTPVLAAAKNNRDLLAARFGRTVSHRFCHAPYPQLRSVVEEMEKAFEADFLRTARSRFRHPSDLSIPASLSANYSWFTARAVPGSLRYGYVDVADPRLRRRLQRLLTERPDVFCVNDHAGLGDDPAAVDAMVAEFLEEYFPLPGPFERAPR